MGELLVILAVALLVFGPKRLPELATGLGKAIREFRRATRDLQAQIEVDDSVRRPIHELRAALRDEPPPLTPYAGGTPSTLAMSASAVGAAASPAGTAAPGPGEAAPDAALPMNEPMNAPVNTMDKTV